MNRLIVMNKDCIINNLKELDRFAADLVANIKPVPYAFIGDLGAGKTTLIKRIGHHLKVLSDMTSPTFGLINEYSTAHPRYDLVYHMDLYRLNSEEEAFEIGIEEYLYSQKPCFIEWPKIIENMLPEETIFIKIEFLSDSSRKILFL